MSNGNHRLPTEARFSRWRSLATARPKLLRLLLVIDLFLMGDAIAYVALTRAPAAVHVGRAGVDGELAAGTGSAILPPPVHLDVDSINVHTGLVDLSRNADGSLETPSDFATAGWFARGAVPGAVGNAVIVGHVDSTKGAAVFYRVRTLVPGALINVSRLDGSRVTFSVDGVQQYGKTNFPTALVYGPAKSAQLRLITCGGRFNRAKHSYDDNIVVFAHQVTSAPLVTA